MQQELTILFDDMPICARKRRRLLILIAASLTAFVFSLNAAAQSRQKTIPVSKSTLNPPPSTKDESKDESEEVVRVSSNLVVVPVSVTDAHGRPIEGLTVNDFRLQEDGQPQEIARLGDPEQTPLELAILIDVSGSVRDRFNFEKESAARFIKNVLKPADHAALFVIDQTSRLEQPRAGADQVAAKLRAVEFTDLTTAFYDTVADAAQYLEKSTPPQHRRVILVISDGEDTYSEKIRTVQETLSAVQRADAVFYSINPAGEDALSDWLGRRGQNEMQTLASATGGAAFIPKAIENLDSVFQQIANELRSQYILEYYEKSKAPAGSFLRITVQVPKQADANIRARQGYYLSKN